MYKHASVTGKDVYADPGNYETGWAFCKTVRATLISLMGNWRKIAGRAFFGEEEKQIQSEGYGKK